MDNNNIKLEDIEPVVHIANYHACSKAIQWGPRTNKDLQFILVVKGQIEFHTNDNDTMTINKGQVLCIYPGVEHTIIHSEKKRSIISGIHCELHSTGTWINNDYRTNPIPPQISRPASYNQLHHLFRISSEIFNSNHKLRAPQLSSIVKTIILTLGETWESTENTVITRRTLEMIQFIKDHINEQINRQDLANAFFVTPEHINLIFKKELGISPTQLINREKCLFAYNLLQQGYSVKEAAYSAGFNDPLYFSRVFRKILQITPSQVQ